MDDPAQDALSAALSAVLPADSLLDTSLDDQYAACEDGHLHHTPQQSPPRTLWAESKYGGEETQVEREEEESERPRATIPTPYQATPPFHTQHSRPLFTPQPFDRVGLATPEQQRSNEHRAAAFTPIRQQPQPPLLANTPPHSPASLTDYRGMPIDSAMRRNLLSAEKNGRREEAFQQAAATALSLTAPHTLLNSLASPNKNHHMAQLEARMQAMHIEPPSSLLHKATEASVFDESLEMTDPYFEVVEASVEEVDAIEEIGIGAPVGLDSLLTGAEERWQEQLYFAHSPSTPLRFEEMPSPATSSPFQVAEEAHPSPLSSHSYASLSHHSEAFHAPVTPSPSSFSSSASTPLSATRLAAPKLTRASSRKKQPPPLPKISPPTLDQRQREEATLHSATMGSPTSMSDRRPMQQSLQQLKLKLKKQQQQQQQESRKPPVSRTQAGMSTSTILSSLQDSLHRLDVAAIRARPPLVPLSPNTAAAEANANPWWSDSERRAAAQQAFDTPKRVKAHVVHTPVQGAELPVGEPPKVGEIPVLSSLVLPASRSMRPASLWAHQIQPSAVHANLRYFTTAYAACDRN